MPPTIARTYGRKPTTKQKTSPNVDDHGDLKRRRVTPDQGPTTGKQSTPVAPVLPTKYPEPPAVVASTKLTKRMLGRSKTESSIDSQTSTASPATRTFSVPSISSSSSQPPPVVDNQAHERRPPILKAVSTPRVRHTYAGQSRSFLISLPVGETNPGSIPGLETQEDEYAEQESYSSLRLRWGVDDPEDDITPVAPSKSKSNSTRGTPSRKGKGKVSNVYLPPNMMNPLKSITELRNKGQSRRFLDEVGYLFEGMDPSSSASLKRSSASEITTKLCDEKFAQNAKAADFYHKAWDVFLKAGAGRGGDKLLDILLTFLVALIARNLDTLVELAQPKTGPGGGIENEGDESDLLASILFFILRNSVDVDPLAMISATDLEFRQIGLSKKDKIMLSSICSTISHNSRLFPENTPITTALLTTHALRNLPSGLILPTHTPDLLHSLRNLLNKSFSPSYPFGGGYSSDSDREEPHYECVRNHFHLLEVLLLNQLGRFFEGKDDEDQCPEGVTAARDVWLLRGLIEAAICTEIKLQEKDCSDLVSELLEVLLRVLVNLTHGNEDWARGVINNVYATTFITRLLTSSDLVQSSPSVADVMPEHEERSDDGNINVPSHEKPTPNRALDRLCLALGLLTNLVQSAPGFKDTLRKTKVSPTCSSKNLSCAKICKCRDSVGAFQILARIYNKHSSPTPQLGTTARFKPKFKPSSTPPSPPTDSDNQTLIAMAEANASLIQATLSILFGLLMDDSPINQAEILGAINAPGDDRTKLDRLVEQAHEFIAFYDAMNSGRVESGRGKDNANEVVGILERLRDGC